MSSVKELVKRWYPDLASAHPNKMGSHRALGDIRESVNELRFYRERVFVPAALVQEPPEGSGSPNGDGREPRRMTSCSIRCQRPPARRSRQHPAGRRWMPSA